MKNISIWVVVFFAAATLPANAAIYTVTTNADSGAGSLREAITAANASAGPHTINFDADYTINIVTVLPTINVGTTITIEGNGWDRTIIDGGNPIANNAGVQAFIIEGSLTLDGVGIQNCYSTWGPGAVQVEGTGSFLFLNSRAEANTSGFYGGAVYSEGSVIVQDSLITGNQAYQGGGMYFNDAAIVEDTTVSANIATFSATAQPSLGGGGITNRRGVLTVRRSLIQGNQADNGDGGGIQTWSSAAQTTVENSTFDGNTATDGGAISCKYIGSASLVGVTVTGNSGSLGGGIYCPDAELEGSIVYRNSAASGPDIWGAVESLGYNLIGSTTGATINGSTTGNLIGVDPLFGPLADNGGPTMTRALPVGSPAIDTGPPGCGGLTTDQRGYPRPSDGDSSGTDECDIGAYEYTTLIFGDGFESGDTTRWSHTVP